METAISVGGKLSKDSAENVAKYVERIFEAGRKHAMEQETIRHALSLITGCVKAENVSISGCSISGGTEK